MSIRTLLVSDDIVCNKDRHLGNFMSHEEKESSNLFASEECMSIIFLK